MSEHLRSFGFKYYPEAFDDSCYAVGQKLVADPTVGAPRTKPKFAHDGTK